MPSVYDLKPRFQALLRPVMDRFARRGWSANGVTLLALAGSLAVGALLPLAARHPLVLLLLPAWLFVRMALNAIDGMLARERDMASDLGAFLNELGDVASDQALYLPLVALPAIGPAGRWLVVGLVLGAALTEVAGILGRALGASRRYDGPMGKGDRALWMGALALVGALVPRSLALWPWALALVVVLCGWTVRNRVAGALRELREPEGSA